MPRKSWLNNRLHHADLSLQWKRRLFSINLKLIHSTQANYPVLSVKIARTSTPAETSKKPWTRDHSRTQRRTEGGETSPGFPVWDHRALANYMLLFPRKNYSEDNGTKPQNPTKLQPYLENSQQSSYLYREVEDYRYNMHILPVQKIGKYT